MKTISIIWLIAFLIILVLVLLSKKEFRRLVTSNKEDQQWRLMGDMTNFYRLAILISFVLSTCLAFAIKYFFNL